VHVDYHKRESFFRGWSAGKWPRGWVYLRSIHILFIEKYCDSFTGTDGTSLKYTAFTIKNYIQLFNTMSMAVMKNGDVELASGTVISMKKDGNFPRRPFDYSSPKMPSCIQRLLLEDHLEIRNYPQELLPCTARTGYWCLTRTMIAYPVVYDLSM
jgi:hypothetical protein